MYQNPPLVDFSPVIFKGNFPPLCMIFSGEFKLFSIVVTCFDFLKFTVICVVIIGMTT